MTIFHAYEKILALVVCILFSNHFIVPSDQYFNSSLSNNSTNNNFVYFDSLYKNPQDYTQPLNVNFGRNFNIGFDISSIINRCASWYQNRKKAKKNYCINEQEQSIPVSNVCHSIDLHVPRDQAQYLNELEHLSLEESEDNHDLIYSLRMEKRLNAAKKTENHNIRFESYVLSQKAKHLLMRFNQSADLYNSSIGNELQYILHKEFVDIINQVAMTDVFYSEKCGDITQLIVDFSAIGISFNNNGNVVQSGKLADFCWSMLEYGQAIGQGIMNGSVNTVQNFAYMVAHPIDASYSIIKQAGAVAYHFSKILYEVAELNFVFAIDEKKGTQKLNELTQKIIIVEKAIEKKLKQTSAQAMLKEGSAIATEWLLTGKVLGSAGSFFKKVKRSSIQLKKITGEVLEKVQRPYYLTPEGLQIKIGAETADYLFSAMADATNNLRKIPRRLIRLPGGQKLAQIPLSAQHYLRELETAIPNLEKLFRGTQKYIPGIGHLNLEIDFMHIFGMEIYAGIRRGIPKQILNGFHLDPLQILEKNNVIKFLNKTIGPGGSYMADLVIEDVLFEGKSFFPPHWSYETAALKIIESLENVKKITPATKVSVIDGITSEGIIIRSVINSSGKIITAFPLVK